MAGGAHDGSPEKVARVVLEGRREPEDFTFGQAAERNDSTDLRSADGERSGLVEDRDAYIGKLFERNDLVLDAETIADVARELGGTK